MTGTKFDEPSMFSNPVAQANVGMAGLVGIGTGVGLGTGGVVGVAPVTEAVGVTVPLSVAEAATVGVMPVPTVALAPVCPGWFVPVLPEGDWNSKDESKAPTNPIKSRITTSMGSAFCRHVFCSRLFLSSPELDDCGSATGGSFSGTAIATGATGAGGTSGSNGLLRR